MFQAPGSGSRMLQLIVNARACSSDWMEWYKKAGQREIERERETEEKTNDRVTNKYLQSIRVSK